MAMAKLVGSRGREVLRGPLMHRKKGSGSWKRRAVIVYCGSDSEGKRYPACLAIYDNYERIEKAGEKKPKKTLSLLGAKIEEPTYASPVGSQGSASPGANGTAFEKACQFLVISPNEVNEFRSESGDMKVHWLKLLTLLTMFPHSVIPEEPSINPINEGFKCKLVANNYGADSAWAIYIMPEEVGSQCHMIGIHILLLKSGVRDQSVDRLEIVSPSNTGEPVVVWDRDKMRRTGKTGNLVFIEIGRRCQGGPGLVWMYAGFEEAHALRETLHRFLFQGDGKAVSIATRDTSHYARPRASVDMSLPSSYQRSNSHTYEYQQIPSGGERGKDSGFKDTPFSHSVSPAPQDDVPPPIRLDKHPSFRKQHSTPWRVPRSATSSRCSMSPSERSGSLTGRSQSFGRSVGSFNEEMMFDERGAGPSRQSVSPPDEGYSENEESGSGQFRLDPEVAGDLYETMRHPGVGSAPQNQQQEEYIKMIPANGATNIPRPTIPSNYDVPPPFRRRPVPNGDPSSPSVSSSSTSPSNYENCSSLPTIQEAPKPTRGRSERSDVYENFPATSQTKEEEFVHYHPTYENMDILNEQRRGQESYQNITLLEKKRASTRVSRSSERESSSTPPTGSGFHLHYAQRTNHTPVAADSTPPLPPRIPVVQNTM